LFHPAGFFDVILAALALLHLALNPCACRIARVVSVERIDRIGKTIGSRPNVPPNKSVATMAGGLLPREFRRFLVGVGIAGVGDFPKAARFISLGHRGSKAATTRASACLQFPCGEAYRQLYVLGCRTDDIKRSTLADPS
jgi:hypothetical protein